MRAAVLHAPNDLRVDEVADPVPGPGDLLVRVEACGVCPSDIRIWRTGRTDRLSLPAVLGHEAVGVVVDVGPGADRSLLGRRIYVDGYGGYAELCIQSGESIARMGDAIVLPDDMPLETLVFVEPLADCIFAVDHCGNAAHARTAFVAGCGQMGLQIVALCATRGLSVVASDPRPDRRDWAEHFGAAVTVDPTVESVTEVVAQQSKGSGAELAIVACPSTEAFADALASLGEGGTCVLFSSMQDEAARVSLEAIHRRRLCIVGARWVIGRKHPHYDLYFQAASLLRRDVVAPGVLVDRHVGLDDLTAAFGSVESQMTVKALCVP